jgi:DNA helicase II / ATP-dependent DNA helicase PcrA
MMTESLNNDQKRAITDSGSPLLITAGPGSGKTRVISERFIHLIKKWPKTIRSALFDIF